MKITFLGAGSTVFARNVLGDCMGTEALRCAEMALYDINAKRLEESKRILQAINDTINEGRARITVYHGPGQLEAALQGARFVVNAIQVGGYDPATIIDFEIPKKYGLRQTIADTIGIGGVMRALRTIPVMDEFAKVMQRVCPNALLLNYSNPMAMLTSYMLRYSAVQTVGLCHSVQICSETLLKGLGMEDKLEGRVETIAGINHMAWLLSLYDKNGNDLYPEIKRRAAQKNATQKHDDMVRYEYIKHLGYYCTESSEHNAEYNPFFIKKGYPDLIDHFNIPLDEYPRRCIRQIDEWEDEWKSIHNQGTIAHERSLEYASHIMESVVTNTPYKINGNVLNTGLIDNLDQSACVEVPCLVDGSGVHPCKVGKLPVHLAAMNMTNVNVQLLTVEAAVSRKKEDIYHAAMLDPHTAAELSIDDIVSLCDEMIEAHGPFMAMYR
ncbi:alpha-glucosidase/alpha-galactosidase [Sphaerochaeta globosa]|uniref:Alpha-galactosidase n=1 Tax=Sphaerochaeta globosa (strain ATCC BAA-1886 / DSM 22777 / Buddy) TaxID=158189 RepID=F0RUA9_SPHGB|nr:alpha-glucosidase/alpha-galactosidase [Sphaerochaeta globosa]ADY12271.1 Alpha-galactosidase [Sphaerochaeta globosa str. Buddy]